MVKLHTRKVAAATAYGDYFTINHNDHHFKNVFCGKVLFFSKKMALANATFAEILDDLSRF